MLNELLILAELVSWYGSGRMRLDAAVAGVTKESLKGSDGFCAGFCYYLPVGDGTSSLLFSSGI